MFQGLHQPPANSVRAFLDCWLLALSVLLGLQTSAFAQQADTEVSLLQYAERIQITDEDELHARETLSLIRHRKAVLADASVEHTYAPVSLLVKSTDFGTIGAVYQADDPALAVASVAANGQINWRRPLPEPPAVAMVNDAIGQRGRRPLSTASEDLARISIPYLDLETPVRVSVTPFRRGGENLALLTYETASTEVSLGAVGLRLTSRGYAVLSQDYTRLYAAVSEHRGTIRSEGTPKRFHLFRSYIRLNKSLKPDLPLSELPSSATLPAQLVGPNLQGAFSDNLAVTRRPNPDVGILALVTATVDARLGVEVEHSGNPIPLLAIAGTVSVINTADSLISATVRNVGRLTGNENLAKFEGIGNSVFRATGEGVGKLIGVENPEAWGEGMVILWQGTTLTADVVAIVANPANASKASGFLKSAFKVGSNLIKTTDKCLSSFEKLSNGEYSKGAIASANCALGSIEALSTTGLVSEKILGGTLDVTVFGKTYDATHKQIATTLLRVVNLWVKTDDLLEEDPESTDQKDGAASGSGDQKQPLSPTPQPGTGESAHEQETPPQGETASGGGQATEQSNAASGSPQTPANDNGQPEAGTAVQPNSDTESASETADETETKTEKQSMPVIKYKRQ